ncbi:MAG: hypothetical protein NTX24_03470 [Candidatus Pacearchaeota archaeon]|nr:hypothetical protein [Candidatus Pacearchaeota archaeon]
MLNEKFIEALKVVASRLNNSDIKWFLTGSSNCTLQGVDMNPSHIGIVFGHEDLEKFLFLFSEFKHIETEERDNGEAKEFFMHVYGVKFLICGEYNHGTYIIVNKAPLKIKVNGMIIPCLSLRAEEEAYRKLGMIEKADMIKAFLKK